MPEPLDPGLARPDLAQVLRVQAHASRLANRRLQGALVNLSTSELHARRANDFPSLIGTLNHLLAVDRYYIAALHGDADMLAQYRRFAPHDELGSYAAAQDASDQRLIAFCERLDDAGTRAPIVIERAEGGPQHDLAVYLLMRLFTHQTHHRGQLHTMLSGTAVRPPQLDHFLMPSDATHRVSDMAALGWTERELFGRS